MNKNQNRPLHLAMILAIIVSAFFLRFYDIENVPSGLYSDEVANGMDALQANESGKYQLFYPENNGREGLFINLQAQSIKAFGINIPAFKLWSAIFGTLAVLGVFLLSRELFRSERAGLISAYLAAFSFWAVNFSRIGLQDIMIPFILTFSFYFLLNGFRNKKHLPFIISGLIFGLGFSVHMSFLMAPAIVIALLFFMLITQKHFIKNFWKQILLFGIAILITLSPIIWEFKMHPEYLESRSSLNSIFAPEVNDGKIIQTFLQSFGMSLAKYNFLGDQNWRHNVPPYPILDPVMGIAFLTGFLYVIIKAFHLLYLRFKHDVHDEKIYKYFLLLAWFFCMLAPEFLTAEGLPNALRSIGTMPVVMIFATIPFLWILGKIPHQSYSMKITLTSLLIGAFVFIGIFNTVKYFIFFKNSPMQHASFSADLKDVAYKMKTYSFSTEKYIVAESTEENSINFLNHKMPNTFYIYPGEIESMKPAGDFVILLTNESFIDIARQRFPGIETTMFENFPGDIFWEMKYKSN